MAVYGKNIVQRRWYPRNPEKYVGDVNNIVARSSWEIKFLNYCDMHPDIVSYASEEIFIHYTDPVAGRVRRYFVDFWLKIRQKDGTIKKYLVEIKPDKFTKPPVQPKRKTKRYIEEAMQYVTNQAKWEAADKVCKDNGMEFIVLTEKHLFNSGKAP